jgi:hypothetical protein
MARSIDEYYSELLMGGRNVLNIFNVCEVSCVGITRPSADVA